MRKRYNSSESDDRSSSDQELYGQPTSKAKGSKRGRKPTDDRWTRVVKFKPNCEDPVELFSWVRDYNAFYIDSDSDQEE